MAYGWCGCRTGVWVSVSAALGGVPSVPAECCGVLRARLVRVSTSVGPWGGGGDQWWWCWLRGRSGACGMGLLMRVSSGV